MACVLLRERVLPESTRQRLVRPENESKERQIINGCRPFWVEKEWRQTGKNQYVGLFRFRRQWWWGRAWQQRNGVFGAEIINPPFEIATGPCFTEKSMGVYDVHFHSPYPRTLDGVINAVEKEFRDEYGEFPDVL